MLDMQAASSFQEQEQERSQHKGQDLVWRAVTVRHHVRTAVIIPSNHPPSLPALQITAPIVDGSTNGKGQQNIMLFLDNS